MAEQLPKRCLYEILAVSRDASADEIRSAYRRLALHLHPDKLAAANGGTPSTAATAAFQDLHHAYEVLSDPKERAYYDSHRNQILFSDPSAVKTNKSFVNIDLYSYFTNSAFSGFTDSGRGFYKVYGDLFTKVYAQELSFAKESKLHPDTIEPSPLIGNLDSPYTQVSAFYGYWLSFDTVLDFAWVSVLNASAGTDRRERRQIEDEKKKARKKAKREYNESVRGLAAFVKKRDKRVIDMLAKKKLQEEKRREKEKAKKEEEERMKMERAMAYEEPEWARVEEAEETEDESEDEEKGREEFKCVACNKKFKSDKQWTNHEQSRKHKDKVAQLKTSDVKETRVRLDYEAPRAARRRAHKATDVEANGVAGDESGTKNPGQGEEVEVVRKGDQVTGKNQNNKKQLMDGTMVLFVKKDSNGELKESSRGRRKVIKYTIILFLFLFLLYSMGTLMKLGA